MSANKTAAALPKIRAEDVNQQVQSLLRSSIEWLQSNWLQVLIAIGIGTVIVLVLGAARSLGPRLARRSTSGTGWPAIFGRAIARTNSFFIVTLAAKLVAGYSGAPANVAMTITFLFTVAAVFQAAVWARELILGGVEHRTRREGESGEALVSAMGLIRLLVTCALFAIALIVVLSNLGVDVTGLVAGLGVGGIAIGLAAQGIFADLFAALAIIFDRPFRRGDKVSYDQTSGVVETIGLKSTRVRAYTGELRVISNRKLLDKELQNVSRRDHIRISLPLGVAYETAPDLLARVPDILHAIVEAEGAKVARAGFEAFGDSQIDVALQFDIAGEDWSEAHATRDRVVVGIVRRFAAEGITIPYPRQTSFTGAPDGQAIMPYPDVQPVHVDNPPAC